MRSAAVESLSEATQINCRERERQSERKTDGERTFVYVCVCDAC